MALTNVCLALLWGLALWIPSVTSFCNVTCSTDYDVLLNCSCSGSVPTSPVRLHVSCRDEEEEEEVNGSCVVTLPQSWCTMHIENLYEVASIGNKCRATASQSHGGTVKSSEPSIWALSEVVKPQPPSNVQVTLSDESYNISWASNNPTDCITYRLRVRESRDLFNDPVHSLFMETTYIQLHYSKLQPQVNYTVDVQAKMCPGYLYQGPWSEWSETVEWRTGPSVVVEGTIRYEWVISLVVLLIILFLLLFCCKHQFWLKRLHVVAYIPRPNVFFESLYQDYNGNFKEWVKPVFSEDDYYTQSCVHATSEKQHDILQWSDEKKSCREDGETTEDGPFLCVLQPHSGLRLPPFLDQGGSQGTGHSVGHVSIHTVTLSGEEFEEEEVMSRSSLTSYQAGESFGSFEEDSGELGVDTSQLERQSLMLPQYENHIPDDPELHEPERLSLDSFASNGQSEDGYPHVDLDTIDSGFVECSSPGASDSDTAEHTHADLFQEHNISNSNYVKQWMICNTIQEDGSNNLDNQLCGAQSSS
ncbi:interleukin 21 receptor, tandem duplicate 1 [Solea solea]|uniref:interleukin 21 receptor, tandem duplicate 1 n=1 Tax=Solea solea TaxID=90069 RepID=UPI00272A69E2|nr:interleukin 21 receptor, tandem duplicate 1 [Solea solea]XP_058504196.1 interleukin 21 receptor, tandem duplicate 1 [Solea solea]